MQFNYIVTYRFYGGEGDYPDQKFARFSDEKTALFCIDMLEENPDVPEASISLYEVNEIPDKGRDYFDFDYQY